MKRMVKMLFLIPAFILAQISGVDERGCFFSKNDFSHTEYVNVHVLFARVQFNSFSENSSAICVASNFIEFDTFVSLPDRPINLDVAKCVFYHLYTESHEFFRVVENLRDGVYLFLFVIGTFRIENDIGTFECDKFENNIFLKKNNKVLFLEKIFEK